MSADNSYTARLERLRNRTLAIFHGRNPNARELGATPMDESTRQQRRLGQIRLVIQPQEGPAYEVAPCCPAPCEPVCPVSSEPSNTPALAPVPLDNLSEFQEFIDGVYGTPTTIPPPPPGYSFNYFIVLLYPPYCNSTHQTVQIFNGSDTVPAQITDLGPSLSYNGFPFGDGIGGIVIIYPIGEGDRITLTASNSCSSSTGDAIAFCFLAGSPVTMEDGSTKPIESVAVGDRVVGAFGEINTVEALQVNPLGIATISNINGEHKTTSHHPHISPDHKFCCVQPAVISSLTYGKDHWVTVADGSKQKRTMTGVKPERIVKLEVGMTLQTLTGPRTVTSIERVPMSPTTPVYHLAVSGSHTYVVDGYAVSAWPREDDFDYDTWTPRS